MILAACALTLAAGQSRLVYAQQGSDAQRERAREHFERGKAAFELKDFEKAIREYEAAYNIMPLPGLIFNIAQCYRNLQRYDEAIQLFQQYLQRAPDAPNRAAVEKLVEELQNQASAKAARTGGKPGEARPAPPATQPAGADKTESGPKGATGGAEVDVSGLPEPEAAVSTAGTDGGGRARASRGTPIYKRWWFWTAVGVVLVGGATAALLATAKRDPDVLPSRFPSWQLPDIQ